MIGLENSQLSPNQSSLIRVRMMRQEHAFCNLQHNFVDTACGSCAWDQNRNLDSLCLKDHGIQKFGSLQFPVIANTFKNLFTWMFKRAERIGPNKAENVNQQ